MDIEKEINDFDEFVKGKFPALWQNKQNSNYLAASMCDSMLAAWLEAKLQAAKAQAVPEGFVVVPKEPTEEMIEAGMGNFDFPLDNGRFSNHDLIFAYRAMIEAVQEKEVV